ncbi:MAG: hypothetical protein V1793_15150 [Pseudomonadota bacterium]
MKTFASIIPGVRIDEADNLLTRVLPYFFMITFLTTAAGAACGYLEHDSWRIGDWLVNYQGGFVRRGLLGEMIYQISRVTHVNPGVYACLLQVLFYAVYFVFSYLLIRQQQSLVPYALLIFSPFIFSFQINDIQGGYRKEVIFFAIMAATVYAARVCKPKRFATIVYGVLALYPAVILTHEMLAVFLPYVLAVYSSVVPITRKQLVLVGLLLVPSGVSLCLSVYFPGTSGHIPAILESINSQGYAMSGGSIEWLDKSLSYGYGFMIELARRNRFFFYYPQILILSMIAYVPVSRHLIRFFKNRLSLVLILGSIAGTGLLCLLAIDWDRFMYSHLVSLFLLTLLEPGKPPAADPGKRLNLLVISVFVIYCLYWHIPHYGYPNPYARSLKAINPGSYIYVYKKLCGYPF